MSNREIIEWLKKKAETVPMPGARKMYQAAAKALEAQKDMISRQAVMDALNNIEIPRNASWYQYYQQALTAVDKLPPAPTTEVATDINVAAKDGTNLAEVGTDCISREQAIDAVNGLIDMFEQILRDIREANVDDSVCGMCEYDGAYIGQSGDWCNECPGFDKDDCFKLSDKTRKKWTEEIIKALPPIQPDIVRCKDCKHWIPYDWMFREVWQSKNIADYPEDEIGCDCCDMAMKANDFCSRVERRTE